MSAVCVQLFENKSNLNKKIQLQLHITLNFEVLSTYFYARSSTYSSQSWRVSVSIQQYHPHIKIRVGEKIKIEFAIFCLRQRLKPGSLGDVDGNQLLRPFDHDAPIAQIFLLKRPLSLDQRTFPIFFPKMINI